MPELPNDSKMIFIVSVSREERASYFWSYLIENFYSEDKKILVITSFRNLHFQRVIKKVEGLRKLLSKTDILWVPPMHFSFSSLLQKLEKGLLEKYDAICFYDFSAYDLLSLSRERFDLVRITTLLIVYFKEYSLLSNRNIVFTAPVTSKQKIWSIIDMEFIKNKNIKLVFLTESALTNRDF